MIPQAFKPVITGLTNRTASGNLKWLNYGVSGIQCQSGNAVFLIEHLRDTIGNGVFFRCEFTLGGNLKLNLNNAISTSINKGILGSITSLGEERGDAIFTIRSSEMEDYNLMNNLYTTAQTAILTHDYDFANKFLSQLGFAEESKK